MLLVARALLILLLSEKLHFISFVSLHFQESTGKLYPGDEIVKIGEKLVCSSSYQDICELMVSLPMTLSLEVKRPVSGKTLI